MDDQDFELDKPEGKGRTFSWSGCFAFSYGPVGHVPGLVS